jgi:flagellar biosynthesis/type III secretory pathway M-ring protein FliF/YscJ
MPLAGMAGSIAQDGARSAGGMRRQMMMPMMMVMARVMVAVVVVMVMVVMVMIRRRHLRQRRSRRQDADENKGEQRFEHTCLLKRSAGLRHRIFPENPLSYQDIVVSGSRLQRWSSHGWRRLHT